MICDFYNNFIKFGLAFDKEFDISILKHYFGEYILIKKADSLNIENELNIIFFRNKRSITSKNCYTLNEHEIYLEGRNLYVLLTDNYDNEFLFIKRLLLDLCNRFFEFKGGIFLHCSSIVYEDNAIIFIGDKGAGKTTNMLYMLNNFPVAYCSNERAGFLKKNDDVIIFGSPSKINIRAGSLSNNETLLNKIAPYIDVEKYEKYKNAQLVRDCSERLEVSFEDLALALNRGILPMSKLKIIFNLVYDETIPFLYEKVDYENFENILSSSTIDGVFPQRKLLNHLFPISSRNLSKTFNNLNVCFYNLYQNSKSDNSKEIFKILKKELKR